MQSSVSIYSISPDSNVIGDGLTTINVLTLKGTAPAGSQISIFDGSNLIGTVLVDAYGFWSYTTATLLDRTYRLVATDAGGGTSQLVDIAVAPSVTSFSSESGDYIRIDGKQYLVQNANKSWSLSSPDAHTLRFEVTGGDRWAHDPSGRERSEISGKKIFSPGKEINVSYSFMVEPGPANAVTEPGEWLILAQFHAEDNTTSPPFAIEMIGEKLAVLVQYRLPGGGLADPAFIYKTNDDIERGRYYDVDIKAEFSADQSGYLGVWLNGEQIVDRHGSLGYDNGIYWKQGLYRSGAPESIAVNYRNLYIETRDPETPIAAGGGVIIIGTSNRDVIDADSAPKGRPLPTARGDLITGKAGNDKLFGLAGDDETFGGGGRDKLFGEDGNDVLNGGRGADRLSGGGGADRFVFGSAGEGGKSGERIVDFAQADGDVVDLSAIDANKKLAGDQSFSFVGGGAFTGVAGELRFSNGRLAGDTNGDGQADFAVKIAGALAMAGSDFLL